jgi:hypothetical protein
VASDHQLVKYWLSAAKLIKIPCRDLPILGQFSILIAQNVDLVKTSIYTYIAHACPSRNADSKFKITYDALSPEFSDPIG